MFENNVRVNFVCTKEDGRLRACANYSEWGKGISMESYEYKVREELTKAGMSYSNHNWSVSAVGLTIEFIIHNAVDGTPIKRMLDEVKKQLNEHRSGSDTNRSFD